MLIRASTIDSVPQHEVVVTTYRSAALGPIIIGDVTFDRAMRLQCDDVGDGYHVQTADRRTPPHPASRRRPDDQSAVLGGVPVRRFLRRPLARRLPGIVRASRHRCRDGRLVRPDRRRPTGPAPVRPGSHHDGRPRSVLGRADGVGQPPAVRSEWTVVQSAHRGAAGRQPDSRIPVGHQPLERRHTAPARPCRPFGFREGRDRPHGGGAPDAAHAVRCGRTMRLDPTWSTEGLPAARRRVADGVSAGSLTPPTPVGTAAGKILTTLLYRPPHQRSNRRRLPASCSDSQGEPPATIRSMPTGRQGRPLRRQAHKAG